MEGPTTYLTRICIFMGLLSLWLLVDLDIERTDFTLFVPQTKTDLYSDNETPSKSGFSVNTNGCRILYVDPMDSSIRKYVFEPKPVACEQHYGPVLVESNLTSMFINKSALSHYNVTDIRDMYCCVTPFGRKTTEIPAVPYYSKLSEGKLNHSLLSKVQIKSKCIAFNDEITVENEFLRVDCFSHNDSIYVDYHAFTPYFKNENTNKTGKMRDENAVSVLMLGLDTMSRLNLYRQMPQTMEFLKRLNASEMIGYNKVGINTFPNLIPALCGISVFELKKICSLSKFCTVHECNFIWNDFKAAGYKTAVAEDATAMSMFNHFKHGILRLQTDYNWKIFDKTAEEDIGHEKRKFTSICSGPRKTIEMLLNYVYKFAYTMKNDLSFGFFWSASLTHDFMNVAKFADGDIKQLLERLYSEGILNKTVLVFLSDHGIRWGKMRQTYQGYLEERLPFLFIAYPEWFRIRYTTAISNLKKNARKLTTPFDLHEVLLDLTNLTRLDKDVLRERLREIQTAATVPRGISLFLPISGNRTCSDAGISNNWCTCHQSTSIEINDTNVDLAARCSVKHINSLLEKYPQCAKLDLNKIISARLEQPISHKTVRTADVGIKHFTVIIETIPGNALFEGTVRHNGNIFSFNVVGIISRINVYGNQSTCVHNYRLRLYCYCIV